MRSITIGRPDDWHVHLRDEKYLNTTVQDISRYFGRAIVMPNLVPPVTTTTQAKHYYDRISTLIPKQSAFEPLMTLYLTDNTDEQTVREAKQSDIIHAFKLYPAGATTHSDAGVKEIESLFPIFEVMQTHGMVLSIHGEVTDETVDIFDREAVFIDRYLIPICERFPELNVIFEHITTQEAVAFVEGAGNNVGATITAHHLLYNRNDLLSGGLKPVYYCLPVLKRDRHQRALIKAATSGNSRFFLGTDSAPHPRSHKESACGCAAGCYTAHSALELYAEVFDQAGALDRLEGFSSHYGADFYGLPRNADTITLTENSWEIPDVLTFGDEELVPIRGGEHVSWRVDGSMTR
ncbi:MAG: dihydroorotase [Pseudomonadales bacterium]